MDNDEEKIERKSTKIQGFIQNINRRISVISIVCLTVLLVVLLAKWANIEQSEGSLKTSEYIPDKLIEEAVSLAIKAQGKSYADGEVITEGHKILGIEDKNGKVKAYTIASISIFGFENGIFTSISGSGAIPAIIIFERAENGSLTLLEYKEPMDGGGYSDSIKKMFPKSLWDTIFKTDKYPELVKQKEEQAAQYLKKIGREAKVSADHVDRQLIKINVEASSKLFSEMTKFDAELNRFPYWIGTREFVINGTRYVYETSQGKTEDGYDLITFKKTKADGTLVLEYQYKIVGSQLQLLKR